MDFSPRGVIPALVTPLNDDETLDEAGLRAVVEHVLAGGVHGVFAAGTQGEFYALSDEERNRVFRIVVDQVAGRVPVYAGTGATTTRAACELTRMAEAAGVDAVTVLTPYFIRPTRDELVQHYRAVAAATQLPVLLYANPGYTGVALEAETVRVLVDTANIVGFKDSSGDISLTCRCIEQTPKDFSVIIGNDALILGALQAGAAGAIAATANVVPRLVSGIYEELEQGHEEAAARKQQQLLALRQAFSLGTFPVVIKEAMAILGICGAKARAPVAPLSAGARQQLATIIKPLQDIL